MNYTPIFPSRLQARVMLPASKSISNRAMLLCALSGAMSSVEHVATCDDTYVMWRALSERSKVIDIQAAGTAMRFLTAYFAICSGEEHILTGTERMCQRPIAPLVQSLRALGANVSYVEREGFPPLYIRGCRLDGGDLCVTSDVSSQYISALLMIAPTMKQGLTLTLRGPIISRPYIEMTLSMMRSAGAVAQWVAPNVVRVEPGGYVDGKIFHVESDWSAASYWYSMVALSPDPAARVALRQLDRESLQGDAAVQHYFRPLGVATTFDEDHQEVVLTKCDVSPEEAREVYRLNLVNQPDLAQTLVVACAMLRRPFRFEGLRSLRIKETDRMEALRAELAKFGFELGIGDDNVLSMDRFPAADDLLYMTQFPASAPHWDGRLIATYHDHRMAMAFAPAALICPGFSIADPEVVSKSYPDFWKDIEALSGEPTPTVAP